MGQHGKHWTLVMDPHRLPLIAAAVLAAAPALADALAEAAARDSLRALTQ